MKGVVLPIVKSKKFRKFYSILGILFILASFIISAKPDEFLRFGYLGVFSFNVIGSGLLIIPTLAIKMNLLLLIFFSALGNIFNTSVNYFIGYSSKSMFSKISLLSYLKDWMQRFHFITIFSLAIIPLPLDLNGLLSGYLGIPYKKYLFINFLGKLFIFLFIGLSFIHLQQK